MNNPHIMVIDDFYPNLDWVENHLNSSQAVKNTNVNYAGVVYPAPKDQTFFALTKIQNLLNLEEELPSDGQGELRLTTKSDDKKYQYLIHADQSFNAVIYLSGAEGEMNGTSFYSHKQFGISEVPADPILAKKMGLLFEHDSNHLDRWDLIQTVPFKVNRAILFDGRFFHSVPPVFSDQRLTQNFFFTGIK